MGGPPRPKETRKDVRELLPYLRPHHPKLKLGTRPTELPKIVLDEGRKLGFSFTEAEIQAVLGERPQVRRKIAAPNFRSDNDVR